MSAVPKVSKIAMKNIISGVHIHNRIVEEDECWRQRRLEKSKEESRPKSSQPDWRKRSNNKRYVDNRQAYMDQVEEVIPQSYHGREPKSNNWVKLYEKIESTCPERWGHAGYKELYPDQFLSTDDESENHTQKSDSETNSKSRKRKKLKSSDNELAEDAPVLKKIKSHKSSESVKNKHKKKKSRKISISSTSSSPRPKKLKKKSDKKKSKKQ